MYIVSFSTGGGYFGITTSFFTKAGVTNGPLEALPGNVTGGDGVYGTRAGTFPNVNGGGMNFWADVAFSPSSAGSSAAKADSVAKTTGGFGMGTLPTTGQSNRLVTSAPQAAPAGPVGTFAGWRAPTVAIPSSMIYRRPIAQAATTAAMAKSNWQSDGA